jgi:hypothetical protein
VLATDDPTLKSRVDEGKQSSADKRDIHRRINPFRVNTENKSHRVTKVTLVDISGVCVKTIPSEMNLTLIGPVPANTLSRCDRILAIRR